MKKLLTNRLFQILVLAAFLRLLMLDKIPAALNWDEVSQGYTAYSISQTGRDEWGQFMPIFFRSYGEWKSAVYIYLLVPMVKFFGLNAWSVRIPSALAGIIAVWLVYKIAEMTYSKRVGLWAAFLMAVTPWTFFLSRPAYEANVALTLMLAGVYFLLRSMAPITPGVKSAHTPGVSVRSILLAALAFGLAPHTYNSAKAVVPILVVVLVVLTRLYKDKKKMIVLFGVLALFAAPILLDFKAQARFSQVGITTDTKTLNEFIDNRKSFPISGIGGKLLFNKATFFASQFVYNYAGYFNPALLSIEAGDQYQQHLRFHGVLYVTEFFAALYGLYLLCSNKMKRSSLLESRVSLLPIALIAIGIIPAAVTRDTFHILRALLAAPGWIFLAALGFASLKPKHLKIVNWILIIEILVYMTMYFLWYPVAYARDWQYGYQQVAKYLAAHSGEYNQVVMTKWYGEPQLFLAFYNAWDPATYQKENIKNLGYESEGRPWLDQLPEYGIGKYSFKYIDWAKEPRDPHTLYIGKADDFYPDSDIVDTVRYPDGSIAFLLVKGDK